eukprot:jgi/Undpi1/7767/HiC_scaffold_23.g10240.m1
MSASNSTTRARRSKAKDNAAGAVDVAGVLSSRQLQAWPIPLKNIRFTEHCRQLNERTVRSITNSIREVGWMPTALPQVTVPDLPDGEDMTSDLAATLVVFVLDGNHRLKAAKTFYDDPEKTIIVNATETSATPSRRRSSRMSFGAGPRTSNDGSIDSYNYAGERRVEHNSITSARAGVEGGYLPGSLHDGYDTTGDHQEGEAGGSGPGTRINMKFKALILTAILAKMKQAGGAAKWSWKGTPVFWKREGKPLVDEALKAWRSLPPDKRTEYGGAADETNTLTLSTSKPFMTKIKFEYQRRKNSTSKSPSARFWRDLSPTIAAIINLDKAVCSNDDDGTTAVQASTAKNNQAFQARVEQRKAHQEMIGNMEEVVDSIRESAEKMGSRNNKNHELAEASLEQGREHARRLDEMDERDEAREAIRDAERKKRQQDFDARQDQAAAVAAKEVGKDVSDLGGEIYVEGLWVCG